MTILIRETEALEAEVARLATCVAARTVQGLFGKIGSTMLTLD